MTSSTLSNSVKSISPSSAAVYQQTVTFTAFQMLMIKRSCSVDDLVDLFRGKIEDPRDFFERVMTCRWHNEDRSGVVIPYRSVIEFYRHELHYFKDAHAKHRRCACGCGEPVFDRKKWATPYCRQRAFNKRVRDSELSGGQVRDFIDAKVS